MELYFGIGLKVETNFTSLNNVEIKIDYIAINKINETFKEYVKTYSFISNSISNSTIFKPL